MHFYFKNITIATFSEPKPEKVTKRKAKVAARPLDECPIKKQKRSADSPLMPLTTDCYAFASLSTDSNTDKTASPCSSNTSRSSTPASTSSDGRTKAGRPKTKQVPPRLSTRCLKRATVLRRNRPVQTSLPQDVWLNIFIHSKPEFLFKARAFAPGFKDAISLDSVWNGSLLEEFGPSLPDPPQGLSYMQYANLLTRHGCQGCNEEKHEGRGKARRTYWAFQRRYCETCLVDKTIYDTQLRQKLDWTIVHPYIGKMMECLPQAKYDSWGHYQWVGDYAETPTWATKYANGQKIGFLKPATDELKAEVEVYLTKTPTEDEIKAWFDAKIAANKSLVAQLQTVEDFCERRRIAKLDETIKFKDVRRQFYRDKAAQMDPPIALSVLLSCESYKRAANIHRPAVNLERSWLTLLPKLEKERVEFEARQEAERKSEEEERKRQEEERKRSVERAHCLMQALFVTVCSNSAFHLLTECIEGAV